MSATGSYSWNLQAGIGLPAAWTFFKGQRTLCQPILQGYSLEVLHCDEVSTVSFPDLMNVTNIGVIQSGGRLGFSQEPLFGCFVLLHLLGQELQSDLAIEWAGILGQIDLSHTS